MKIIFSFCLAVIAIIFSFASCDDLVYNPHLENPVDIEKPHGYMRIDLTNAPDTLFINGQCDLKYVIDTGGKKFCELRIYVDSTLAGTAYDTTGYSLNPGIYGYGYHSLKLETWVFSGNGSLADAYHSEFLVASRKWTLFYDNSPKGQTFPLRIFPKDGRLVISWDKCRFEGFDGYAISRSTEPGNTYGFSTVASIKDRNQNSWTDSSYIGGPVLYTIGVHTKYNTYYFRGQFSDAGEYLYPIERDGQGRSVLKWRKCKYYANFKKYVIQSTYINYNWKDVFTQTNFSDTSAILSPTFGAKAIFRLKCSSAGTLPDLVSDTATSYAGNSFVRFGNLDYIPALNSIYIASYSSNGFLRLDASTLTTLAKGGRNVTFSRNGKYAYEISGADYGEKLAYIKVDPLTLQQGKSYYMKDLIGYNMANFNYGVTGGGFISVLGGSYSYPTEYYPQRIAFFDLNNSSILYSDSSGKSFYGSLHISGQSDEGEYIVLWDKYIYNLKDRSLRKIGPVTDGDILFLPSGKEYAVINNRTISIYKCSNNTLQRSFSIQDYIAKAVIDPATGYIGGNVSGSSKYRIYDLNTGSLKKELELAVDMSSWSFPTCFLANSFLFSTEGYYMKIQY